MGLIQVVNITQKFKWCRNHEAEEEEKEATVCIEQEEKGVPFIIGLVIEATGGG